MIWQARFLDHFIHFLMPHITSYRAIQRRRWWFDTLSRLIRMPEDIICIPAQLDQIPAEWIKTLDAPDDAVILYLHGGGYVLCSVSTHRDLLTRLVKASGIKVLGINYRLAPEHPFPAALNDATQAYRWLLNNGFDPQKIIIAGDSAGGGLTVATMLNLRDFGDPLPAGAVCLSPWVDLAPNVGTTKGVSPIFGGVDIHPMAQNYVGDNDPKSPKISPVYADLHSLPPLLIQVGSQEILLDDSLRLAEVAKQAGVDVTLEVWEGMVHVFQAFSLVIPEGEKAIKKIGKFIQNVIGSVE